MLQDTNQCVLPLRAFPHRPQLAQHGSISDSAEAATAVALSSTYRSGAGALPNARTPHIRNVAQLTESALVHLTSLGALSLLAFFECPSVSDAAVEKLLKSPSGPFDLVFHGAPLLTRRVLECHTKEGSVQHLFFSGKYVLP